MVDKLNRIAKVSLKRGLPPSEHEDLQPQRKIPASVSRSSRHRNVMGRQYNGQRHQFNSQISILGTRRTEQTRVSANKPKPDIETTDVEQRRIDTAEQVLIDNGINPHALHPQQLQNFALAPSAAQQQSINTYQKNLQLHHGIPPPPQSPASSKATHTTISKDSTAGDEARVTANLASFSRNTLLSHRAGVVYRQTK
ncbi:hypothetical protein DER46DRAFT_650212 [Fusarium sp. MPI-SDFR-AT-0072]|nr:hypothetical protein DER46DRAFT_650212 [Fusarium sp. MPI-SDFR-AT-0072]